MSNEITLLGKKPRRSKDINDDLYVKYFSIRIKNSKEMHDKFLIFKSKNSDLNNFKLLEKIIDINEINPVYNYEFLKLQKKLNIKSKGNYSYMEKFNKLSITLSNDKYYELKGEKQKNPANELYELLKLYTVSPELFDKKTENIKRILYNIPLIESVERVRINYYLSLLENYKNKLTQKEINFLRQKKLPKTNEEKRAVKLYKEYNIIKNGIKKFTEIIKNIPNFFAEMDLDKNDFNFKNYLFILYMTKIIDYVDEQSGKDIFIINLYKKEFNLIDELKELPLKENNFIYKNNTIGIMKVNEEEYIIYNDYEKINFNGKNYVLSNLIEDFNEHRLTPINYILERNKTLKYFFETNLNFLNDNDIYPELLKYFKTFIKSKCLKEFLEKNNQYKDIINLIKNGSIINEFLNSKYLKSSPLFDFGPIGYTNKDIMIYLIIGTPLLIENYKIKSYQEYQNIRNLIFLFNVGIKFIILLKLFFRHCKNENELLHFEELFFGKKLTTISIQEIITILNGDCLKSFEKFKLEFSKDFEGFQPKSQIIKNILKKYTIDFNLIFHQKIVSKLNTYFGGIFLKRNLTMVLPSFTNF